MLGGDQAGEHLQAAGLDDEVVIAADEIDPAQLLHLQAPARRAEIEGEALKRDDAVAEAVQMRVPLALVAGEVVDQPDGGVAAGEELLQRQHLAPVAQRVLGQQPHFRQAVEHHAPRLHPLHLLLDQPDGAAELHLPGVQDRLLAAFAEHLLGRGKLEQLKAGEVPAVRRGDGAELLAGFRQGDVEAGLALLQTLEQELEREGGLARPGGAFDQVEPARRQASAKDGVEAGGA